MAVETVLVEKSLADKVLEIITAEQIQIPHLDQGKCVFAIKKIRNVLLNRMSEQEKTLAAEIQAKLPREESIGHAAVAISQILGLEKIQNARRNGSEKSVEMKA